MILNKYFKTENVFPIGEILRRKWKDKEYLSDQDIETSISELIFDRKDFVLLSSVNIEVSMRKKEKSQAFSSLRIPTFPWKVLIIMIHDKVHWSCLMYVKETNTAYHYDSIKKFNQQKALKVFLHLKELDVFDYYPCFHEKKFIRQNSNFECGYFLIFSVYIAMRDFSGEIPISNFIFYENSLDPILFDFFDGIK